MNDQMTYAGTGTTEDVAAEQVLRWGLDTFRSGRVAVAAAFGPGSTVLIHMLSEIDAKLPILFIDTLHHFSETLAHVRHMRRRYALDLRTYRPARSRNDFEARHGPRLWERNLDEYQRLVKVEPFRRATASFDAWFTGRRRDQSPTRTLLPLVEPGTKTRINPLAAWTRADVWRYIRERELPYNPLHDRDYTSIGDAPLTTRVLSGEDERAGRWRGATRLECGIHDLT